MNKPYFAKWLPVEGEIKWDANTAKNEYGYPMFLVGGNIIAASDVRNGIVWSHFKSYNAIDCKCIKLFLCSRDIQVGDMGRRLNIGEWKKIVNFSIEETETIDPWVELEGEEPFYLGDCTFKTSYKVIGEISPDALGYVKKGDEFDESEVKCMLKDAVSVEYSYPISKLGKENWEHENFYIIVKGMCGHFH